MESAEDVLRLMMLENVANHLLEGIEDTHGKKNAKMVEKLILKDDTISNFNTGLQKGLEFGLRELEDKTGCPYNSDFLVRSVVTNYTQYQFNGHAGELFDIIEYKRGIMLGISIAHAARTAHVGDVKKYLEYLNFSTNICTVKGVYPVDYNPLAKTWRQTLTKPN